MTPRFVIPQFGKSRGPRFWLNPLNLWDSRRKFLRADHSNEWRYEWLRNATGHSPEGFPNDPDARTRAFDWLLGRNAADGFRFIILGDTGEGDASQYALLPLIRSLQPDFMIINGDVAYPAGDLEDFAAGFFAPYRGLNIPVWAVPGNHEYYSTGRGREFFEVFCSRKYARDWEEHGLILKEQPGTFWELSQPSANLVILGIDSGQSGALDGRKGFLGILARPVDQRQHAWLEERLRLAERRGASVMVLFHIPQLVDAGRAKVGLSRLHAILSRFPCVRLVVTAHIHNLQCYSQGVFEQFLRNETGQPPRSRAPYFVSGGGGAYIGSTEFKGPYPPEVVYPPPADFAQIAQAGHLFLTRTGLDKTMLNDFVAKGRLVSTAELGDEDQMKMLSLLLCDYRAGAVTVTPYYFPDLAALYPAQVDRVDVQLGDPRLTPAACATCARDPVIRF